MIIISDGHVASFTRLPIAKLYSISEERIRVSANSLYEDGEVIEEILEDEQERLSKKLVVFYFGEADASYEIYDKSIVQDISVSQICRETAENYVSYINGFDIPNRVILLPPPQGTYWNPIYPSPSREDRHAITNILCQEIESECKDLNVPCLDIYPEWRDEKMCSEGWFIRNAPYVYPRIAATRLYKETKAWRRALKKEQLEN